MHIEPAPVGECGGRTESAAHRGSEKSQLVSRRASDTCGDIHCDAATADKLSARDAARSFRVGQQRYIVPTLNIERSFRPTQEQLTMVLGKGELVRVRTGLLPIYRLQRIFNLNEGCEEITDGLLLILEIGKRRACVFVDEILGQQQVVIKNLGDTQPQIRGVSGGAILGDGLVALIVDVGGLLETAAGSTTQTQLI